MAINLEEHTPVVKPTVEQHAFDGGIPTGVLEVGQQVEPLGLDIKVKRLDGVGKLYLVIALDGVLGVEVLHLYFLERDEITPQIRLRISLIFHLRS